MDSMDLCGCECMLHRARSTSVTSVQKVRLFVNMSVGCLTLHLIQI